MLKQHSTAPFTRAEEPTDWVELLSSHFVPLNIDAASERRLAGDVDSVRMASLQISTVRSVEQTISRNHRLINHEGGDHLGVSIIRRGQLRLRQDGRECIVRAGDLAIYDTTRPFEASFDCAPGDDMWTQNTFVWSKTALRLDDSQASRLTARELKRGSEANALMLRSLYDLSLRDPEAEDCTEDIAVALLLSSFRIEETVPSDLYQQALIMIRRTLDDSQLTPTVVAASLAISTRHLHRIFANQGTTVATSIRRLRLEQCRREIYDDRFCRKSLTQISQRWGFTDLAVFSRVFKQEYGISPRQYRRALLLNC